MIDLHLHLDGAMTEDDVLALAKEENYPLPENWKEKVHVSSLCTSLQNFFECFEIPKTLTQTPESLTLLTKKVLKRLSKEGLVYVELRFAPSMQTLNGMSQEEAVKAVLQGMKESESYMDSSLILCFMRRFEEGDENQETLRLAKKYFHQGVVALDLADAENIYKTKNYSHLFRQAKEAGIPFTIHAGEADNYTSVDDAISFGAKRIGHGIHALENSKTIHALKEKKIPLEICPTSEIQTKCVPSLDEFPMDQLLKSGLILTLNTDDPGISNINLAHEYHLLAKEFSLKEEELKQFALNSVDYAFCTPETKKKIRKKIDSGFSSWYQHALKTPIMED